MVEVVTTSVKAPVSAAALVAMSPSPGGGGGNGREDRGRGTKRKSEEGGGGGGGGRLFKISRMVMAPHKMLGFVLLLLSAFSASASADTMSGKTTTRKKGGNIQKYSKGVKERNV